VVVASLACSGVRSRRGKMPPLNDAAYQEFVRVCGEPEVWHATCPGLEQWFSDAARMCGVQAAPEQAN